MFSTPPPASPGALAAGLFAVVSLLGACASPPAQPSAPLPLAEQLRQAEVARAEGVPGQARSLWLQAARDHPTSKQPWLQLADDHVRAGEHGGAIAAAQEAVQRDPLDREAQSILALSGLRIATVALAGLREHPEGLPGTTRGEASALTRLLRESLGEPAPPVAPAAPPPKARTRGTRPAAAPQPAAAKPAAPAPAAPAPAPAAPAAPAAAALRSTVVLPAAVPGRPPAAAVPAPNPFDRLR
ncbi:tetratricopeptide repeat protein [Rubrivivax gelatinosus]|uniref:Tetratricopeptide repeat protein n=1 Tax=Rubrivivax gelatinosus TaxID=28068 RepID=A0A4R2M8D7_RUBGE|nr:tetratricopeptide repeat protein [Rubrivivax gelatinosus]TCP02922.1 hypothetical protein EV684_10588 [Rubrivivax gelatinosus]